MPSPDDRLLVLIDGYNLIFRAFYAIPPLNAPDGTPTNAALGFTRMVLALLNERRPPYRALALDGGGENFRHRLYPQYKANRAEAPPELKAQFPLIPELAEALALPLVSRPGVEADDIIGTLSRRAAEEGFEVLLISGDKDLMQLVDERVRMLDTMKGVLYDRRAVVEKLGVPPELVPDLLALQGDSSDNIPGVSGIGPKTAVKLLKEHGSLEGVLQAASRMKPSKLRDHLLEEAELARLSLQLATIRRDLDLDLELEDFRSREPDPARLDQCLSRLGFTALRRQLGGRVQIDRAAYRTVLKQSELEEWMGRALEAGECAIDLETDSLDAVEARAVGFSLCVGPGQACYIPVAHDYSGAPRQLAPDLVAGQIRRLLGQVKIYGQNLKYDALVLKNRFGIELPAPACDSMLASYVLDPERASHGLDALAMEFLGHRTITYEEVTGKGKDQIPFSRVSVEQATRYSGEDADVAFRLCRLLGQKVSEEGLGQVLERLELPLVPVLVDMESWGVLVDGEQLKAFSRELEGELERLEQRIHFLAGHQFNINSPAQLRVVLYEELGLPAGKRTKSGASTDSSVLEELAPQHEIAAEILNYRSLAKLKSTYLDVLPEMINPRTGRIHTRYNQAVTATGRLSSSDPNLQNIPVRTEHGRRIRQAFRAPRGRVLLSADYSQIELRILAHLADDENLQEAFRRGEDIHAATAARVFNVEPGRVDKEMRARAKAVNFGIVYGQGAFNLSRQLGISRSEAQAIIDAYFERFPRIHQWIERVHAEARRQKAVYTMFGRRRKLPDIDNSSHNLRANAERMAQNTPIQGTAADIIKLAMIELHREIKTRGLESRLVLQVHDELVIEAPGGEVDLLRRLIREKMEGAAELKVPLTVDMAEGKSWAEAHP
jgi:DNA polymerase-1